MRRRVSAELIVCGLWREGVEGMIGVEEIDEGVCHREKWVRRQKVALKSGGVLAAPRLSRW